jgi:flagellar hook-basal body complex protein FliE
VSAVLPIGAVGALSPVQSLFAGAGPQAAATPGASFAQLLTDGLGNVSEKMAAADAQVKAFAIDDTIPLHQVTFALEEARMSLELMVQVRTRLLEAYQQIMQMQM